MHSSIHSLAHRAPPATRSRVRWQPYNAIASASLSSASTSSLSSRSPSLSYLSTPATSVSPPSPHKPTLPCETERLKAQLSMPQTPRDPSNPPREHKSKYATGLVGMWPPVSSLPPLPMPASPDQAVKSLCEIWRPQDIPNVFLTSSKAMVGCEISAPPPPPQSCRRGTHLPSASPLTRTSPSSPVSSTSSLEYALPGAVALQCDQDLDNRTNLVPIKGFVHEVLRRSRTSGSVLQTALCYLEAIRPKVPELILKEQSGQGGSAEFDSESRVTLATAAELELEAQLAAMEFDTPTAWRNAEDVMDTVRVCDNEDIACTATPSSTSAVAEDSNLLTQQPQQSHSDSGNSESTPLPSPLLCPRRAFLASLILASKFTQDKCYSNRAWAKLSGLPAREIGRCERALGDALDWRLWVGKTPATSSSSAASSPTPTPASVATGRPVVRCRSEATLTDSKGAFLVRNDKKESKTVMLAAASSPVSTRPSLTRGLRRSSTLPADAFAEKDRLSGPSPTPHYESTWIAEQHRLSFSNIAQQDQDMGSPEFSVAVSPCSPSSTYSSQQYPSPIPPTPSLSYSPSSTESSSGDRTIQMSTFMDDNMAPYSHDVVVVSGGNDGPSHWSAPHSPPTLPGVAFEAAYGAERGCAYPTSASFMELPGLGALKGTTWSNDCASAPHEWGVGAGAVRAKISGMPSFSGVSVGTDGALHGVAYATEESLKGFLAAPAISNPHHLYHSHIH
ncbi:hypothetical protein R3P38DRAFT_3214634 [Favolaschia claudopus]|uniref:Uncharacterized protein n=1 Tax=Favolaschia claudopus TaxID=2862362 RepID=A0AAW0AA16_9AGAR